MLSFAVSSILMLHISGGVGRDSVPAPLPHALATISTDTGALAPGHRDFARYEAPGWCFAAAQTTYDIARGTLAVQTSDDTLRDARADTVGVAAAAVVARHCLARFPVLDSAAEAAGDDHMLLFRGALLMQDETLAQSLLAYVLHHDRTPAAQVADKIIALSAYLGLDDRSKPGLARPPLLHAAHALADELLRTGPIETRFQVDSLYLEYWSVVDSLVPLRAAAETLLATYRQEPAARMQAQRWPRYIAYRALMRDAFFREPDSVPAVTQRAIRDSLFLWPPTAANNAAVLPAARVTHRLLPISMVQSEFGQAPVVHGARWYLAAGAAPGDTVFPAPGKASLFIAGGVGVASIIRKWRARYSPQQLAITVYDVNDDTAASWWEAGDDNLIDGPLTVAARGDRARWYYQDYEHLAVNVDLELRHVQFNAWPFDHKRIVSFDPWLSKFFDAARGQIPRAGLGFLTDATGKILWIGNPRDEPAGFDRLLAWAVTHPEGSR